MTERVFYKELTIRQQVFTNINCTVGKLQRALPVKFPRTLGPFMKIVAQSYNWHGSPFVDFDRACKDHPDRPCKLTVSNVLEKITKTV